MLQSLCLAYGGPGRSVAVFEPTYALHSHIAHLTGTAVVEGQRRPDFSLDLDVVRDVLEAERPAITFLCSPNNPTGLADDPATVRAVLAAAPGLVVVDEAYGQFADWSALTLVDDDRAARGHPDLLQDLVDGGRPPRLPDRARRRSSPPSSGWPCPYHLDALKQAAGRLAVRFVGEMEERVGLIVRERHRLLAALGRLPVTAWPSQANFILFRPEHRKGAEVWQGLLDRSVLVRDTSSWPRLADCLRVTVGTPEENDAFLAALAEVLA